MKLLPSSETILLLPENNNLMGHASNGGGKAPAFSLTGNYDMNGISEPKLLWYMCRKFSWLSFDTKYG